MIVIMAAFILSVGRAVVKDPHSVDLPEELHVEVFSAWGVLSLQPVWQLR